MVGARDANLLAVIRVRKEALTSARHMEAANVACGVMKALTMALVTLLVSVLQEAKKACVFITIHSSMKIVSMGVSVLPAMHFLREIDLQTLKQAGRAFSRILWRLLIVRQPQLLRVGCTVMHFRINQASQMQMQHISASMQIIFLSLYDSKQTCQYDSRNHTAGQCTAKTDDSATVMTPRF
ncbi:hypothetical protein E2562_013119 [Oryza meyeriana var. granulata]|uniref:Uncharacterized protein n=1 Tax=Oryza meyeriana var. granulata TaxID=110450 RepID=A0A6G1F7Q2_9ORYZ|nr:hypothetical protein E2562_013119 [Oryza meyeriana var. granulata]